MDSRRLTQAAVYGAGAAILLYASHRLKKKEPVPLDVQQGTSKEHRPLKWAFLGAGRVAHDFANAMKTVEGAVLYCVAVRSAKDLERCESFQKKHGFQKMYGSYADALADPDVDVVYLSAMHSARKEHVPMILKAKKHVVVEKPIALNLKDAEDFFQLAKENGCFLMEGMWTRFFPAVEKARELCSEEIGHVVNVVSDFGFDAGDSGRYPKDVTDIRDGDPIYHSSIGGGALLWAGPYPIAAGLLPFAGQKPTTISATGTKDPETNIELSCAIGLAFEHPGGQLDTSRTRSGCPARGATASLFTSVDAETSETTTYIGQSGRVIIDSPGHCPTRCTLLKKASGRGQVTTTHFDFPLPPIPRTAARTTSKNRSDFFFYPNSIGFAYEIAAVSRCIAANRLECPQYSSNDCLTTMRIISFSRNAILSA